MCGIVGIVYRDPERGVSSDVVRAMCGAIQHRGPDDEGIFVRGRVGIGMRRLSIIDLEGGQQPIATPDGSATIVFNGEIYNYREIRSGLVARGHHFRSEGDTETILNLYREMGPACVERLRGMFAFAIWDDRTKRLLLARDRFGMKPLYVISGPWGLAFASELKSLHAVGLTGGDLDWNALLMYFHFGYVPAPFSPFRNVRKLEPGHTLEWQVDGTIETRRYWDLPVGTVETPSDVEARVRAALDQSVAAHLVSDVPVASFLSGGLDSSAVVSSMAMVAGDVPQHAYIARYRGADAKSRDETPLAQALAKRYGVGLTVVDIEPNIREIFEPIVWALDEPHADGSSIPTWLISEAVAADYKVALTGTGGDELFAGYRRHIGMLFGEWYQRLPRAVRRSASAVAQRVPELRAAGLGVDWLKRFLAIEGATTPQRYMGFLEQFPGGPSALFTGGLGEAVRRRPAEEHLGDLYDAGGRPSGLTAALYLDYKAYLPDDLLHLSDRIAMAHSLEIRLPFVDHVLIEEVFPLADSVKIGFADRKRLLRRALEPRLPREHLHAPKRGFVGPTAAWLRHELRDMLVDELSESRLARLGYFDPKTVQGLVDEHLSMKQNRAGVLWALMCFSTWHRMLVETETPAIRALDQ